MFATQEADGAGRGYFAEKSIRAGTLVMDRCRPLVWAVKDEHVMQNCHSCLQPVIDDCAGSTPDSLSKTKSSWVTCPKCLKSVFCSACLEASSQHATDTNLGSLHNQLECDSLVGLSKLEQSLPHLADSLLGGSTTYLRLLLRVLALRAGTDRPKALSCEEGSRGLKRTREVGSDSVSRNFNAIEELEDHLDDILGDEELGARVFNTVRAAKMVAPAVWKASQDECASLLGKL